MYDEYVLGHIKRMLLQWGRNMFVAECKNIKLQFNGRNSLQWGRNMFVAEC